MLHSVRTRLVLSYLLVGVTAALAVGLITYLIADTYFRQREAEYLRNSAAEIADDVRPVLQLRDEYRPTAGAGRDAGTASLPHREQLVAAVRFYSFLGQRRVIITDPMQKVLADSGTLPQTHLLQMHSGSIEIKFWEPGAPQPSAPEGYTHIVRVWPGEFGSLYSLRTITDEPYRWYSDSGLSALYQEEQDPAGARGAMRDGAAAARVVARVAVDSDQGERLGYVQLAEGQAYGAPILRGIRLALAGGVAAAVVLAVVVGLLWARQINRPLAALGAAAERMAAGDLAARAPAGRRDEFGQLARRFNGMAERLQTTVEQLKAEQETLRRFIADASHELRTPLTALKSLNTVLLGAPDLAHGPHAGMMQAGTQQIERLDALTQGLLDLSRLDTELSPGDLICEDLRPLLGRAAAAFRPLMAEKGLELTVDFPAVPALARHDPVYLRRAVDNLLGNALKFTPPGGRVALALERAGGELCVSVTDTGPGIPTDELARIFDRFFRGRAAAGTEGSGLGLAIVQAVARAHSGRVTVDCSEGCRFTLHLPEAAAPAVG